MDMYDKLYVRRLKIARDETAGNKLNKAIAYVLKKLGPGASKKELLMGIKVEQEHGPSGPLGGAFDIVKGDETVPVMIAAAHIAELPDYYTRLAHMEDEGEEELEEIKESKKEKK